MANKFTAFAFIGFAALTFTVAASAFNNTGFGLLTNATNEASADYVETLDKNDAPTTSTAYVETATTGGLYNRYTFTDVKATDNMLCTLDAGGTITKEQAALDLEYVHVVFQGSLTLETSFTEEGAKTTYTLTSGEQTNLCGNYVSFTALEETTIESITLVYVCRVSYTNEHHYVKTDRTVTNGDDLDAVYQCENCDHEEVRVDPTGFKNYRNGEMINVSTTALTITKETETIAGVSNSYKVTNATDSWNDKIEPAITSHKLGTTNRANVKDYQIKAISFDIYADSTATQFRIASPSLIANAHKNNFVNFLGYVYSNTDNPYMKIYNPTTMEYAGPMNAQTWYTVVIEYPDLTDYNASAYVCAEICKIKGDLHFANVKYWHTNPRTNETLGLVFAASQTPTGSYTAHAGEVGGRTGVYAFKGTGTYKDQLDINWTTKTADSGIGSWVDIFYKNRANRVKSYSVDVYLPAGTSVRLQGASTGAHLTNFLQAGGAYGAFNNGTFQAGIKVYNGSTEIAKGATVPADTWVTVTYDVSAWLSGKYVGGGYGYLNCSLTAPNGTIYVTNLVQTIA